MVHHIDLQYNQSRFPVVKLRTGAVSFRIHPPKLYQESKCPLHEVRDRFSIKGPRGRHICVPPHRSSIQPISVPCCETENWSSIFPAQMRHSHKTICSGLMDGSTHQNYTRRASALFTKFAIASPSRVRKSIMISICFIVDLTESRSSLSPACTCSGSSDGSHRLLSDCP
jgi:hypothetical protein